MTTSHYIIITGSQLRDITGWTEVDFVDDDESVYVHSYGGVMWTDDRGLGCELGTLSGIAVVQGEFSDLRAGDSVVTEAVVGESDDDGTVETIDLLCEVAIVGAWGALLRDPTGRISLFTNRAAIKKYAEAQDTVYRLQVRRDGQWETVENGEFASEAEADASGDSLRETDPNFAVGRMRVVDTDGDVVTEWTPTLDDLRGRVDTVYVADDGNAEVEYDCVDSATEAARAYVDDGDWGDESSTSWVTIYVYERYYVDGDAIDFDETRRAIDVAIEPEEPKCSHADGHDWRAPFSLLGGLREDPGVQVHGGGAIIREVCVRCGCEKVTDTWAQNPENGRQGLTSVSYEESAHVIDHDLEAIHWDGNIGSWCDRWFCRATPEAFDSREEAEAAQAEELGDDELVVNFTTSFGDDVVLRGESVEELAREMASYGDPDLSATVRDSRGFVRGWIHGDGAWRAN